MHEFLWSLFFTIIAWFLSLSVLAPAIVRSYLILDVRLRWLATFNARYLALDVAEAIGPHVEAAFECMRSYCEQLRNGSKMRILEIGVGTGVNFHYYPRGCRVICVENNPYYLDYYNETRNRNAHVVVERTLTTSAEDMSEVPDGIVDCVVSTYSLSAVDNVTSTLKEIRRVLRPGGCFLFVEHVSYPANTWNSRLQKLASPLYRLYCGYDINRRIGRNLLNAKFTLVEYEHFYPEEFSLCTRPHIVGIATK